MRRHRKSDYAALQLVSQSDKIDAWLAWSHRFPEDSALSHRTQIAELEYVASSQAM